MNSEQAKKLSLPDIMSKLGYEPISIKKGGNEYWYNSPFRIEKEPSFHTSFLGGKWIWNDFGDSGGTVIDFIMRHENYFKVSEALAFLDTIYQSRNIIKPMRPIKRFSFQQQSDVQENALELIQASPVQHIAIFNYLTNIRKIEKTLIEKYLLEIKYKNKNTQKEYFGFGMKNDGGGCEVRVASDDYPFKSALEGRDITTIKGFRTGNGVVNIFEGMTDYLSLLTMLKTDNLAGDAILMHSLSSFQRTVDKIRKEEYSSINLFLDNNPSGQQFTDKFIEEFGKKVSSQSSLFLPFEDVNEMLKANRGLGFPVSK